MFTANTGMIATRFLENGISSNGTLTSALKRPPERAMLRKRAEDTIIKVAKANDIPVGVEIHKILSQSIPELNSYVQFHGEAPSKDLKKLAIQAALLRATEIGTLAKALNVTDEDALNILEDGEQEHVENNEFESSVIMSPDTAAAVCMLVYRLSDRYRERGGSGNMSDFVVSMKKATNSGDFDNMSMGYVVNNFSGGVNNAGGSGIIYTAEQEQEITGGVTQVDEPKSSFWDNLFSGIDKVVDGITKVSGAVQTTVGNVKQTSGSIIDQITNIGGEVGSKSIDNYLKENWLKIVGIVVVLIIFTILIVRVGRK